MMTFDTEFADRTPRTRALFERAKRTMPGGAGSTARLPRNGWKPYPLFMAEGTGSRFRRRRQHLRRLPARPRADDPRPPSSGGDHGGRRGDHDYGTCFGLPYELEIEAAEKVVAAVPGIEQVRFTNSGSEAVGTAVRLARATTGRRLIVRFEGHYHGWQDTVYWSNHVDPALAGPADHPRPVAMGPGVPAELEDTLVVLTWNDPESFVRLMDDARRRGRRGAHRARGVQHRVHPARARLPRTAARADRKYGAMLIFDEVITGFRFARGGAQEWFGVTPDITTLAKGLGGGFPVAAVGGTVEAMRLIAEGVYSHRAPTTPTSCSARRCRRPWTCSPSPASTNVSAHWVSVSPRGYRARRRERARRVRRGARHGVPAVVRRRPDPELARRRRAANEDLFTRWYQEMVVRGVLFHPLQFENLFVSLVHDDRDIDETLNCGGRCAEVVAREP